MRLSELQPGSCFRQGKTTKKKLSDGRIVSVIQKGKGKGQVKFIVPKNDPLISSVSCDLQMLGLGLRKHPEFMVEMGSGRPLRTRIQKLK
jgi:hypothetical protein